MIRHGEKQKPTVISSSSLTAKGREQAEASAILLEKILGRKKANLFTSPIARTVETAKILSQKLGIETKYS